MNANLIVTLRRYALFPLGFVLLAGLYLTHLYGYLLFHSLAEVFSIVIAFSIFVIFWNARRFIENSYFLFISIAYLFVGILDLLHTLSYRGMGVFSGYDANLPTQLWIAARYMQSIAFLLAPLLMHRKLQSNWVLLSFAASTGLIIASIFYWQVFPTCYVEGVGLTPFKRISEYIISTLLLVSIVLLLRNRERFEPSVLRLLVASIIVTIGAELAFTFYVGVYDLSNLIGHFLKIISFGLVYVALVRTGLQQPYDLLFRDLKTKEQALEARTHDLDIRVRHLECLYRISSQVEQSGTSLAKALQNTVNVIPSAWQYPDDTCARIVVDDQEFSTPGFRKTPWQQACELRVKGQPVGSVEVYYPSQHSEDGNPFLPEERRLLESIAHRLGRIVERLRAEEHVKLNEQRLNALLELGQSAHRSSEQEIVQEVIERVAALTQSEIGYVHYVDPDENSIQLAAWTAKVGEQCKLECDSHFPVEGAGVWADCIRQGRPVVHNDYESLPGQKGYPEGHVHLVRHASVPIFDGNDITMILGVGNKAANYDDADVRQILLVGDQLVKIVRRWRDEEEIRISLQEKNVMLQEIHHRVKNNLQVISSLLDMQAMTVQDPQALQILQDSRTRVRAMASIHERLYQSPSLVRTDFVGHIHGMAANLMGIYPSLDADLELDLQIGSVEFDLDRAIPLGLILNELMSNAFKHAFPPTRTGSREEVGKDCLHIDLHRQNGEQIVLVVSDNGIGLPADLDLESSSTLGLRLVKMLTQQLDGTLQVDRSHGTAFKITFPHEQPVEMEAGASPRS